MLPEGFFGGVAKYPFRTLIPTGNDAIEAHANYGIIRGGHDSSQQTGYFFRLISPAHILW